MLELCARREKRTCEKGGNPKQRSTGVKLNLRVLCPNYFTGKEKHLSGLESSSRVRICFFVPPTITLWDEHTSIAQCSTKCCVKRPARARISFFSRRVQSGATPRALSFSLSLSFSACRRENGIKRYDITTEQTVSLPTDKSTSLSTHGSHSDTQSSPQRLLWNDK